MGESASKDKQPKTSFWQGIQSEFKKISWPDKKTIGKQAAVVTAVSVVTGLVIALVDVVLQYGIDFLTKIG